ncbi:uncharacterized protein LOC125868860 [Solanum stenotomum]|uniref:uncharacterized protein LOC125868860 n=1 Tax=Solanum stenotomum TaxID=172797 RepID=UPI0020D1A00B|nr:uncharacterized protein LOC125868860 [Solanum stenotomum]
MHDYINAEDIELWDIILDGPYIPTKEMKDGELTTTVVKTKKDYNEADMKKIEKNYKAKKILVCEIGAYEYNRISACETAKEIWDCLQTAHEGTHRVKVSKVDMLTTQYEKFIMKEGETIFEMNSRFTSITNELRGLGEPIPVRKQIHKILKVLPKSWESKVDSITEAKDLMTLPMDELIGNLQTYEMNKKQGTTVKEGKKEKYIALKVSQNEVTEEEDEMAYVSRRFQKILKKHGGFQKKTPSSRTITANDICHKYGKPGHFMRNCPSQKQETYDTRPRKRDLAPDHARRKAHADQLVRKDFAVWGNDSSESEEDAETHEDVSMMAIKDDENVFNSIFSLMAKSNDEEDLNKVTLFDLKDDLDTLPIKILRKLVALLIDFVNERTTENLMLNEKLSLCEDENSALMSQVSKMSVKIGTLETSIITPEEDPVTSLETNSQLRKDLSKVKEELSHSLKWTDSSKILSNLSNQSFNGKKGLGRRPIEPPYNSHSKYVSISDNLLCTYCGRNGHLKEKYESLRKAKKRHVKFVRSESDVKKGHKGPGPLYRFSKNTLPLWTKRFLIKPLDSYWELRLKWVPKSNK